MTGHVGERIESRGLNRCVYTCVHGSITHKGQKVETAQYLWAGGWINQMWSTHPVEYYSALKWDGILTHVAVWISLG